MWTVGDVVYREKSAKADSSGMQTGREVIKVGQEGSFRGIRISAIPSKRVQERSLQGVMAKWQIQKCVRGRVERKFGHLCSYLPRNCSESPGMIEGFTTTLKSRIFTSMRVCFHHLHVSFPSNLCTVNSLPAIFPKDLSFLTFYIYFFNSRNNYFLWPFYLWSIPHLCTFITVGS